MGRWVRWFGAEAETVDAPPTCVGHAHAPSREGSSVGGKVLTISAERARQVAGGMGISAPTGQLSAQTLPAEMLTAVLVEDGIITREDEHACLQEHRTTGRPAEEILIEDGYLGESEFISALSRRCKVPHLSLEHYQIRPDVLELVPSDFARTSRLIPLERLGRVVNVATSNPLDVMTLKRLEEDISLKVKPVLASPKEIRACMDRFYPAPEELEAKAESADSFRFTAKDLLKGSWLASLEGDAGGASQATEESKIASGTEAKSESAHDDQSHPIPMSDDESVAFVKSSSETLVGAWTRSLGIDSERALAALPVLDAEWSVIAADAPAPAAKASPRTGAKKSGRKKVAAKKKKKKAAR